MKQKKNKRTANAYVVYKRNGNIAKIVFSESGAKRNREWFNGRVIPCTITYSFPNKRRITSK